MPIAKLLARRIGTMRIPRAPPIAAGSLDQPGDLILGQMLAAPIGGVGLAAGRFRANVSFADS
jgi:hypothetical protein